MPGGQPDWVPGQNPASQRCCTTRIKLDSGDPNFMRWYEGEINCASLIRPKPKGYGVYTEFIQEDDIFYVNVTTGLFNAQDTASPITWRGYDKPGFGQKD